MRAPGSKRLEKENQPAVPRWGSWLPVALVVLCFILAGSLRVYHFFELPGFNPADDTAFFTTEDALQYRYARIVSQGGAIPAIDPMLHHPDGFDVRRNLTTLVENVEGRLYQVLGRGQPLHVFLIVVVCFTTSLGVFAAAGTAASLWKNRWAGVFAAFLYSIGVPTYIRIIGGYGTEHFALPFLFLGIWLLLESLKDPTAGASEGRRRLVTFTSGSCFALALSAWHLSRFLFTLVLLVLAAVWVYLQIVQHPQAERIARLVPWLLAPTLLASLLIPILQVRPFWSSPVFLTVLAIPLVVRLGRNLTPRVRVGALLGSAVLLMAVSRLLPSGEVGYSHVWGAVAAKIAHLGIKPADPAELPFEARVLWIEDVRSPGIGSFLLAYGTIPLLALLGAVVGLRWGSTRLRNPETLLFLGLLLGSLGAYLLFQRMTGFCAFFLIVLAAGAAGARRPVLLLAVLLLLAETHRSVFYAEPAGWKSAVLARFPQPEPTVPNWSANVTELFSWVRRHTRPGEAFLTRMGMGPTLLAFADRPVVLQSKMENREIWPRLQAFLTTLYGPEEEFYQYCRRYQVRYFLYDAELALDRSGDSERFTANALRLPRTSTAYRCQFSPETLQHLRLVYQNSYFRVFEVAAPGTQVVRPLAYQPGYDIKRYGPQGGEYFSDSGTPQVMAEIAQARRHLDAAKALLQARRPGDALAEADRALAINPGMDGVRLTRALALALTGQNAEALHTALEEVRYFPDSALARYYAGLFLTKAGRPQQGLEQWNQGLRLDPGNPAILGALQRQSTGVGLAP